MTADSGIATVERADRARGVADVCAPHWCHWIAVTFQGPSSGPELKHRGILEAKSDEVKKTKKKPTRVYVFVRALVWASGTRSELSHTASPWQNRLDVMCVK